MTELLGALPLAAAERSPDAQALKAGRRSCSYAELAGAVRDFAGGLLALGIGRQDRVAVYADKSIEAVTALFGTALAGCVMVPVNPLLKPEQLAYILRDCGVVALVTTGTRLAGLKPELPSCPELRHVVLLDDSESPAEEDGRPGPLVHRFADLLRAGAGRPGAQHRVIDQDMAAILYTSGSTGNPKGVVLSHRNMVAGAHSVASYLGNHAEDRILALLPLSFDYGFSQLTTGFLSGATVVLHNYFLPMDTLRVMARERITGLAAVPPLWIQLAALDWPEGTADSLRYFTNSGGAMPTATLERLRRLAPRALPYLMYGLTEAFRSTYLPPEEIDRRPTSMGRAIPNAEILVVREDGTECAVNEPGELVHRGVLVALGYWNDPVKTAERFRPLPGQRPELVLPEMAVWSGDTVRRDEDGFLYFVSRRDEMIKTSGYRVSPTEVEEAVYRTGLVAEAAALGIPHPVLGQAIVLVAQAAPGRVADTDALLEACRDTLPGFMLPARVDWVEDALPRNANGKIDRKSLAAERSGLFEEEA